MADKMAEVYNAYDMEVLQSKRGRGAILLKTNKGIFQVKTVEVNEGRLRAEFDFKEKLVEAGFTTLDNCVKSKEGEMTVFDRYNTPYVMRHFFEGRECCLTNMDEVFLAVDNLAKLHKACREAFVSTEADVHARLGNDFRKRNQEMKRVYKFILRQKNKNDFEKIFIQKYNYYYEQALICEKNSVIQNMDANNIHLGYCHGMYNQHSVLMCEEDGQVYIATINFDRFYVGNQLDDLYHFMRKTVEKNEYQFDVLKSILERYQETISIDEEDFKYLYMLYSYPEKYYKLSNQYISSAKNWLSPKLLEKLEKVNLYEEKKQELLAEFNRYINEEKEKQFV